ncbi:MAG: hypothetical protein FWD82_02835, partial [Defluviitaleaceae bacterium]|nr:hypothetical protein [Defluviitaleaceae bacterium]
QANLVTEIVNRVNGEIVSSFEYSYYLDGNMSTIVENCGTITGYTYDVLRRLTVEEEIFGFLNDMKAMLPAGAVRSTNTSASVINRWRSEGYPTPPGWNEQWQWRLPEGTKTDVFPRWFDPQGGEWRWHAPDRFHSIGHWDYNPWTSWNSGWQNIYPPFRR